ncbi:MAG: GNAT family N-acetyltransferase [Pyrinomonadaceae bacterium]|nr:GNAT family N-acetyltransferase [Pyrinomonadaceae bacterium]
MPLNIRSARELEASLLTELAIRSKGHWGYDAEFLEDCRVDLTITPEYIASHPIFVLEEQGKVVGFYSLERQANNDVELMHLFVEPAGIGGGHGRRLWQHAVESARKLGFQEMVISSDPQAEAFYKAMGARRVGEVASIVRAGRMLPLVRFTLPLSSPAVL